MLKCHETLPSFFQMQEKSDTCRNSNFLEDIRRYFLEHILEDHLFEMI